MPGLVIQGGVVTSVNASAKGTFSVFGLNATPNLTVVYQAAQGSIPSSLDLYGSLSLTNSEWGTNLDAILGNATNHGMSIQNGVLSSLNVGLTGSFSLAKVTFTANSLQVIYDQANNDLTVSGEHSVSIGLGNRFSVSFPNNGLTINPSNGNFVVNSLALSFDATFGLYSAHAALDYAETNGVITVSAMGMLTLPGPIVIAGGFTLQNGTVTDIKLSLASPSGLQTPVPGLVITSFSGDIRPTSNFSISATVGLSYLNFPYGGGSYPLFTATGSVTVTANEMDVIGMVALMGGQLGSGTVDVSMNWTNETFALNKLDVSLYHGAFEFDASATFNGQTGTLDATASGILKVPDDIWLIGGFELAGATIRLHVQQGPPHDSYVTGSATVLGSTFTGTYYFDNDFELGLPSVLPTVNVPSGYYLIESAINPEPDLTLQTVGGSPYSGANTEIDTLDGSIAQLWYINKLQNGYATIIPANGMNNNVVLDAFGASTQNGTTVGIYTGNGGQNQQWSFTAGPGQNGPDLSEERHQLGGPRRQQRHDRR